MSPRPTILIVAPREEIGVRAAARRAATLAPDLAVQVWSAEDLIDVRWSHRVGSSGEARTTLTWQGQSFSDRAISAVWFRERCLTSSAASARWAKADRDYAEAELRALWVSLLRSLGPRVVNGVDGTSPSGPTFSRLQWLAKAREVGLPLARSKVATSARLVPRWRGSPYDARRPLRLVEGRPAGRVLVVAGQASQGPYQEGLGALSRVTGCDFLEVTFACDKDGQWGVFAVDPLGLLDQQTDVEAAATMLVRKARAAPGEQT